VKEITIAAAVLATALALAGCSSTGQAVTVGNAPKTTKTAAPLEQGSKKVLTTAQATAALPTLAQVGLSWVVGDSSANTGGTASHQMTYTPASCSFSAKDGGVSDLAIVPSTVTPVVAVKGDFQAAQPADGTTGMSPRSLSVSVKSYKDDIDPKRLDQIAARLSKCTTFSSTVSGSGFTAKWNLTPVSLPNYGDGTLAFRMQATLSILVILIDSVQIVAGHNIVTITQSGLGKSDPELVGNVAKFVMANLDTATK
jgi:hypothetical protein